MSKYPDPIITKTAIVFDLKKPLYGSTYSIYKKWLDIAKDRGLVLIVKTEFGVATYQSASEWVRGAKIIKKYHNFNEPMIMYSRSVLPDIQLREKRKKIEKRIEMSSNTVLNGLMRLKKNDPAYFDSLKAKLGIHTYRISKRT